MRISDWSSDVCSSDLQRREHPTQYRGHSCRVEPCREQWPNPVCAENPFRAEGEARGYDITTLRFRSEEHTSELQSLMRISYAVFCLKKKTRNNNTLSRYDYDTPIIKYNIIAQQKIRLI